MDRGAWRATVYRAAKSQTHHSLKASILWHSAFFMVQLSYLAMQAFVSKVMSLFFNTLSRFVIAFLPRSKYLLISWLQSLSTVIWDPKNTKSVTVYTFSPSICHEMLGLDVMILLL